MTEKQKQEKKSFNGNRPWNERLNSHQTSTLILLSKYAIDINEKSINSGNRSGNDKKKKEQKRTSRDKKKYLKWKFHWMGLINKVKTVLVNINTG